MKTFEQFININSYKVYHGGGKDVYDYPELGDMTMDYIFVVDESRNVKGFATRGFYTEEMEKKGVHAIGTIGGPHMGKYLYDGFISYFGKICPTSNESDMAKKSWKKKFDSSDYIKEKIEGIGYYWRYPEEEYLNTVFDIKKKIKVEELPYEGNKDIYEKLEKIYKDFYLTNNKYTIGQSRIRDEYLIEQGKNPENEPYKNDFINEKFSDRTKSDKEKFIDYIQKVNIFAKIPIIEEYKKELLKKRDNHYYTTFHGKNDEYFSEFSSQPFMVKFLYFVKNFPNFKDKKLKLCDMGCGVGSVVYIANKMGYDSMGVELQTKLKEYHDEYDINVIYDNFFEMDLSFLKTMDVIYLYRPIRNDRLSEDLLNLIYNNTKDDVIILYSYPHYSYAHDSKFISITKYLDSANIIILFKK